MTFFSKGCFLEERTFFMDSPELWVQTAQCGDRNPVARCEEVPPIPPCSVASKSGRVTLRHWSFDIFFASFKLACHAGPSGSRDIQIDDQLVLMSQDVKSNAELSMSAFLRDNPTYENGFNKRGQAHMMAQGLNVACLLFLTQKWVLFDSLPIRYAGYVGSVLARCSRCTFRSESVPTEYIPPLLFGAHSASCLSKGLAPNRKSPPVVTPV